MYPILHSTIVGSMVDSSVILPSEPELFYTCIIVLYVAIISASVYRSFQYELADGLDSVECMRIDSDAEPTLNTCSTCSGRFNSNIECSSSKATAQPSSPVSLNAVEACLSAASAASVYRKKNADSTESPGYLHLIVGPMYAGKSTELLRHIRTHRFLNRSMYVVNHEWNMRYNVRGVSTHSGETFQDCVHTMYLLQCEMDVAFVNSKYVFIEELQFFPDAVETVTRWVNQYHKCVYAAALNGDYLQVGFGTITPLYAQADEIQHVTSFCGYCNDGTRAPFTYKVQSNHVVNSEDMNDAGGCNKVVEVGGKDMYVAVCRRHYITCMNAAIDSISKKMN